MFKKVNIKQLQAIDKTTKKLLFVSPIHNRKSITTHIIEKRAAIEKKVGPLKLRGFALWMLEENDWLLREWFISLIFTPSQLCWLFFSGALPNVVWLRKSRGFSVAVTKASLFVCYVLSGWIWTTDVLSLMREINV